ncbi:ATP-binding protein [Rhodoblastus acidophilus]|uniref:ATP-binding protein n=1 Tax=Candidatus Rhodoblastus alkanivorans TaxID=2954117 RepID=A0ABS9Z0Q2_9HYPH|nr:ATP-binding protein [Candidatus Rhodoblastus alkanivorans]MCI4678171.1 ATP-binding protein [Candidatus Rhodoblastus alkanivorans]MCI4681221.1 ATP-binding protein [Candidatus Rhodoblastus alkanivorans]MDI4642265.1 ATP-binding protein [Rhodoblastus acidophilus]
MSHDDRKRAIGKVVSVAADRFVVEMHVGTDNFTVVGFDGVHYVARLGSFLMIPSQSEYVVVEVVGLRERDASTPSERGDFDRAGSSKYLDVVPVGMLPMRGGAFRFGVSVFPSLYADALYALDGELDRIFETEAAVEPSIGPDGGACEPEGATRYRVLPIGKSVVFENYDIKVRLNEFFGGHVAVLGNTGSGKSCTVASVLQSLFSKPEEHHARGATFVVFDVNGEYHAALAASAKEGAIGVERVVLDGTAAGFRMPHWFLEMAEWELLLQASERTQLPVLRTALGLTSLFHANTPEALALREHFVATCIIECFRGADGDSPVSKFQRVVSLLQKYPTNDLNMALLNRFNPNFQYGNFSGNNQSAFLDEVRKKLREDAPLPAYNRTPFSFDELHECLDFAILYEEAHGNRQIRDYCSSMVTRLRSLQERTEYAFLRHEGADVDAAVSDLEFLTSIVGLEKAAGESFTKRNQVIIIDLNSVEDEIVELVSAVIARMLFRFLRHAEPRNRFPIHLLLEEAHRYVASTPSRFSIDATKIFERIAKEGRKYGMFVLLASQRPSELSKTVLSQCSNFLVHRIQNPDDLSQIRQMTPFISESVLKRLPSLPRQHALVFGTSVNLPTTFKVREASPRPRSDDTAVVDLWFHEEGRAADIRFALRPADAAAAAAGEEPDGDKRSTGR